MPELPSKDVAHTQSTDHRILRHPGQEVPTAGSGRLEAFPESEASVTTTRDLGLAWDSLAQRGVEGAGREANEYLHKAEKDWPNDATLLSALGFAEQQRGHKKEAEGYFERALKVRPQANTASADLGILEAQSGRVQQAVELWEGAFERAPYRSAIGIDLAMVFCAEGHKQEARRYVLRVLEFNPDYARAKQLLAQLDADPGQCKP